MTYRTLEEAKQWIDDQNLTVAEWARQNGFTSVEVGRVLNGKSKCTWGRAREVAKKLNIEVPKK